MKKFNKSKLNLIFDDIKIRDAYNSTHIEGNTLTIGDTVVIMNENRVPSHSKLNEVLEVYNYNFAWEYLQELIVTSDSLKMGEICEINFSLMNYLIKNPGKLREHDVAIIGASFTPSKPLFIYENLQTLISKYDFSNIKNNEEIIKNIVKFHIEFEMIHPFSDGNGRTGRMIMNVQLIKNNLFPIIIPEKERSKYISFMDNCSQDFEQNWVDSKNLDLFTEWIKNLILESEKRYFDILKSNSN